MKEASKHLIGSLTLWLEEFQLLKSLVLKIRSSIVVGLSLRLSLCVTRIDFGTKVANGLVYRVQTVETELRGERNMKEREKPSFLLLYSSSFRCTLRYYTTI